MTIQEAIDAARRLRDTEINDAEMVAWLSTLDEQLWFRVTSKYGMEDKPENLPYTDLIDPTDQDALDVDLMLEDKYGLSLYPLFIVMQVDLHHGDYERFNNDAALYAAAENAMKLDYSREKKWKPPKPEGWPGDAPWDGRINIAF